MSLPETWFALAREDAAKLEAELHRELPTTHLLHGRRLVAVARRFRRDDVLFTSPTREGEAFWVHLTWSVETDPQWPFTVVYQDMTDFAERWPREELEDPEDAG